MSHQTTETARRSFGFTPSQVPGPQLQANPGETETTLLPPDAVVDLAAARRAAGVDDVLARLDTDLIGLAPVKTRIAEIAALLLVLSHPSPPKLGCGYGSSHPRSVKAGQCLR